MRKAVVLDTSVLLYDAASIEKFEDNDIYIPLVVVEELDKKKSAPGLLGENARKINRLLDKLRADGHLFEGVSFNEVSLYITKDYDVDTLAAFTDKDNDNLILASTAAVKKKEYDQVRLVTKDLNLRVKADVLGIDANDFYSDYADVDEDWVGWRVLEVEEQIIDNLYHKGHLMIQLDVLPNEFVVLKCGQKSALALQKEYMLQLAHSEGDCKKFTGCAPKNKEQQFALQLLSDTEIPLLTMTGMPGSGKTYLAFMAGIEAVSRGNYERIIYTRPIQTVDKGLGFLPGDIDEKFGPYLAPIEDNFRNAFGDLDYYHCMRDKGQIDIAPISFIRGRSLKNCFIIVDEAQNATIHELKTIITRVAEHSKIVLIGDTKQIDTVYLNESSNGLTIVSDRFKKSPLAGHIHFTKGYRSRLASEADKLLD